MVNTKNVRLSYLGDKESNTREMISASNFLIAQINKGWTTEEALSQAESVYGWRVMEAACKAFDRYFHRQKINN